MMHNLVMLPKVFNRPLYSLLLCLAAGALSALSMAPANLWPVLFISLPILYIALSHAQLKRIAFAQGWLFGFGYFVCSLSWIGNALLVDGNPYAWAWPLAVSGLPALLAFFTGFATLLIHRFCNLKHVSGFIGFVVLMFASEIARGHLFTGFPWNLFGYAWADMLEIVQIVSLGTVYLLSVLTIFWATTLGFIVLNEKKSSRIIVLALTIVSFAGCFSYGDWRIRNTAVEYHDDVQIRLVQPNVKQSEKWRRDKMAEHFATLLQLSASTSEDTEKTTYIVWPETAINNWFTHDPGIMGSIRSMLYSHKGGASLITGALLSDPTDKSYSNSIVMIERDGTVSNIYNKHHLVPFGEYIPFQKWIPLKPVVQFTGFKAGDGLRTLKTAEGLSYSPLVCYEILFPGRSFSTESNRPDFIVNVTNDAWYGLSAGPHQHFTQAIFRAVETGIPVLRAANTGFTGVITPLGSMEYKTQLFQEDAHTYQLPKKASKLF